MTGASAPQVHAEAVLERAVAGFVRAFGRRPTQAAAAPGRVNLIGEHTDYNGGFVLPIALDRVCVAVGAPAAEGPGRALAVDLNQTAEIPTDPARAQRGAWVSYVGGALAEMRLDLPPIDLAVATSVPIGAGLSSSASLEVAVATLAEAIAGRAVDPVEKALACQRAEHAWAGVPCGVMDQLVSVLARDGHALLIDCRSMECTHVPVPDGAVFVVADTGVRHTLAAGEYGKRRSACASAAAVLGVESLRDASEPMADDPRLSDEQRRCVLHVTGENARVLDAVEAMREGDLERLGRLMDASHRSLRDHYRVSCEELDDLAASARGLAGVLGARMTGGGFGGCVVALVQRGREGEVLRRLGDRPAVRQGLAQTPIVARPAAGAGALRCPT